jgi:hypothetical protein
MSLILSGTDGLSDVDGTAATPAIRGTDANTGIFFPAADTIAFAEGGVECARFDSSGNFGIGTTAPAQTLHVKTSTSATPITLGVLSNATGLPALSFNGAYASTTMAGIYANGGTSTSLYYEVPSGNSHFWGIADSTKMTLDASGNLAVGMTTPTGDANRIVSIAAAGGSGFFMYDTNQGSTVTDGANIQVAGTNLYIYNKEAGFVAFGQNNAERARIDSSGNLLVGDTSVIGSGKLSIKADNSIATKGTTGNGAGNWIFYRADNSAKTFEITANATAFFIANNDFSYYAYVNQTMTAWAFASDRRIKTDIVDIEYGLNSVLAIKPRKYKIISSGKTSIGFIAQELQTVIPEAVSGEEIEYLDTDTPQEKAEKTMGISKETLIPVLVKAIQEQQALITQLTARITALESA